MGRLDRYTLPARRFASQSVVWGLNIAVKLLGIVIILLAKVASWVFENALRITFAAVSRLVAFFPYLHAPLRPVRIVIRETAFFLQWIVWLFSWITLGTGGGLYISITAARVVILLGCFIFVRCLRFLLTRLSNLGTKIFVYVYAATSPEVISGLLERQFKWARETAKSTDILRHDLDHHPMSPQIAQSPSSPSVTRAHPPELALSQSQSREELPTANTLARSLSLSSPPEQLEQCEIYKLLRQPPQPVQQSVQPLQKRLPNSDDPSLALPSSPAARQLMRLEAHRALQLAETYGEWTRAASILDILEGEDEWRRTIPSRDYDYVTLQAHIEKIKRAREQDDPMALLFVLQGVIMRDVCGIEDSSLYVHSRVGTKHLVEEFYDLVCSSLRYLAHNQFPMLQPHSQYQFFKTCQRAFGRTALCLSGGGALAMYHIGVVKALLEADCMPTVITGTSGGSIVAALVCTRTDAELKRPDFLTANIVNRYGHRWLPTLQSQASTFFRKRVLMDHKLFASTTKAYYGDITFEEAHRLTGRILNITVASSGLSGEMGQRKGRGLTLNYITAPRVLIWSAVCCSCALPGLMQPQTLYAKDFRNEIVPFQPQGTEWCDGTLHHDIPLSRVAELFHVTKVIVSQVNPHVRPFLGNRSPFAAKDFPFLTGVEALLSDSIAHLLNRLVSVGAIPRIYGQDISHLAAATQKYSGHITILPQIGFWYQFKVLSNPTESDMEGYIRGGSQATWPYISQIRNMLRIERVLDECKRPATLPRLASPRPTPYTPQLQQLAGTVPNSASYEESPALLAHPPPLANIPLGVQHPPFEASTVTAAGSPLAQSTPHSAGQRPGALNSNAANESFNQPSSDGAAIPRPTSSSLQVGGFTPTFPAGASPTFATLSAITGSRTPYGASPGTTSHIPFQGTSHFGLHSPVLQGRTRGRSITQSQSLLPSHRQSPEPQLPAERILSRNPNPNSQRTTQEPYEGTPIVKPLFVPDESDSDLKCSE